MFVLYFKTWRCYYSEFVYALVFKVVQYLSNLSIFVTFVQYLSNTKYTVIRKINRKYFLFSGFPKFAKRLAKTFCFEFMTCSNLFRKIAFLYSIMTFTRKYNVKYCKSWKEGSNVGKFRNRLYHSHKKRKDSLETRAVFTWISILTWNFGGGRSGSAQADFDAIRTIIECFIRYIMII